jgi:hypothetical protein
LRKSKLLGGHATPAEVVDLWAKVYGARHVRWVPLAVDRWRRHDIRHYTQIAMRQETSYEHIATPPQSAVTEPEGALSCSNRAQAPVGHEPSHHHLDSDTGYGVISAPSRAQPTLRVFSREGF